MEIRAANDGDIPAIVDLLKLSLGEALMPKSDRYWRWKHVENPFGASPVLLCFDGSELLGVRAFMRWEWVREGEVWPAVRAVDTATHPEYQGKGIFKKLTLALVDECLKRNDFFVFNTPNGQSKPGYLKMGWIEAGKLPLVLSVRNPLRIAMNLVRNTIPPAPASEHGSIAYFLHHNGLPALLENDQSNRKMLTTKISVPYLIWRYMHVPVANYVAIGQERANQLIGLMIGRIKDTRFGRELRITDSFLTVGHTGDGLAKELSRCKKEWHIDYLTASGTISQSVKAVLGGIGISVGPMVTARSLKVDDLSILKNFEKWSPTLGDLELF